MAKSNAITPETNVPNISPKGGKWKKIIIALVILTCLAVIAVLIYLLLQRPEPEGPPTIYGREEAGPISNEPVDSYDEIVRLTEGKPLPDPMISGETDPNVIIRYHADDEHIRGDPSTPIVFIEYADLRSRYAGILQERIKEFLNDNQDVMHWAIRHYPYGASERGYIPSQASECVFLQLGDEGFWTYVDMVFKEKRVTTDTVYAKAKEIGVDEEEFNNCMDTNITYNTVLKNKQNAVVYESIQVTPSFIFFNTLTGEMRIIDGVNSIKYFQAILDAMLGIGKEVEI